MILSNGRLFGAGLLGLALALSISGVYAGLGLFVIFGTLSFFVDKKSFSWTRSPLDMPIAVLLVWGTLVSQFSDQYPMILFFLFAHAARDSDARALLKWFLIGSAVGGAWAAAQAFSGIVYHPTPDTYTIPPQFSGWPRGVIEALAVHTNRAVGSRSHALTYAECLMPAVFLFLVLFTKRPRRLMVIGFVLTLLGVFFAQGRAVWLGVFAGLFVFSCFMPLKKRLAAWTALLFCVVAIGALVPSVRGRALSAFSSSAGSVADQQSKQLRFFIWKEAFGIIKSSPLVGVGKEGVKINFKEVPGYEDRVWSEAHSIYLQQAAERGVIGLGLLLWVFVVIFRAFWRAPSEWRAPLIATLTAFLVAGLTESWINDSEVTLIFWTFVGAAHTLLLRHDHDA